MEKHRDERFISRVLTEGERRRLEDDPEPARMLWALWACKETAYKVAVKRHGDILWAPARYEVRIEGKDSSRAFLGTVATPREAVFVELRGEKDFLHCVGSSRDLTSITKGIGRPSSVDPGPAELSFTARSLLLESLAFYEEMKRETQIVRSRDVRGLAPPALSIDGKNAPIDISISHDGRFVGYAYAVQKS
jgi:phosphopantetheinyl transferase (holo-ACP synthase)